VAGLLDELRTVAAGPDAFVAHTHGGRFFALLRPEHARAVAEEAHRRFAAVSAPIAEADRMASAAPRLALLVTGMAVPMGGAVSFPEILRALTRTRRQAGNAAPLALESGLLPR
jgi:hypothetical protein